MGLTKCVLRSTQYLKRSVIHTRLSRVTNKESKGYSVRKVAEKIGVEPAFLSKVERDIVPPPSEKKIIALAKVLDEDPDILLAMAGKVCRPIEDNSKAPCNLC